MKKRISKIISVFTGIMTPARVAAVAAVAAFFCFVVLGDKGIYTLRRVFDIKNRLLNERIKLNDDIDRLTKEKEILSDPANLEMTIRSELGYIKPGEIVFEEKTLDPH